MYQILHIVANKLFIPIGYFGLIERLNYYHNFKAVGDTMPIFNVF